MLFILVTREGGKADVKHVRLRPLILNLKWWPMVCNTFPSLIVALSVVWLLDFNRHHTFANLLLRHCMFGMVKERDDRGVTEG